MPVPVVADTAGRTRVKPMEQRTSVWNKILIASRHKRDSLADPYYIVAVALQNVSKVFLTICSHVIA